MTDQYQGPGFGTEDTFVPDNLFAGDFPVVSENVTIEEGQDLTRGAVLGKVTYSGECKLSLSAASDGSQTPFAILAVDVDATAAAVVAPAHLSGIFNERALTIGTGHTAASIRDGLRALSIFLKSTVAAGV